MVKLSSTRQKWERRYANLPPKANLRPTEFVAACLPQLPTRGRALDIAAGSGRHTIALAQRGLQVDALDISWYGLRYCQQHISIDPALRERINLIVADIERPWLPRRDYEAILVSFFLYRPLFDLIKERLLPGGWLIYETFLADPKNHPNQREVRPEFRLQSGELGAAFSNFKILFYDEGDHTDRVTAQLLARKE